LSSCVRAQIRACSTEAETATRVSQQLRARTSRPPLLPEPQSRRKSPEARQRSVAEALWEGGLRLGAALDLEPWADFQAPDWGAPRDPCRDRPRCRRRRRCRDHVTIAVVPLSEGPPGGSRRLGRLGSPGEWPGVAGGLGPVPKPRPELPARRPRPLRPEAASPGSRPLRRGARLRYL